ncbi:MAG: CarD family transcriptional regulator [Chloroflexota bacterium]|nr:CarD family transcriptional regulator [Chloroflexota bacterium]
MNQRFEIGNKVVHPYHGAGTIVGIKREKFPEESKQYYIIDLIAYDITLLIPVDSADEIGLRHACKATAVPHIMDILRASPDRLPDDYRERQALVKEKMEGGDAESMAEVVCALAWHRQENKLTKVDARLYERALTFLAGELALIKGITLKEAKRRLRAELPH